MRLPWITAGQPGCGGVLRAAPEDFGVDEALPYAPSGEGPHIFVRFEKLGLDTAPAVQRITEAAGLLKDGRVPPEVGYAGNKDRHARTRQWMSLPWDRPGFPDLGAAEGDDLRVLEQVRHGHKLRRGHQAGNHFDIVLRDLGPDGLALAHATLARLRETGVPHYFGPQRFGRDDDNDRTALAFLRREAKPPKNRRLRDLMLSALQSRIFNAVLARRIQDGTVATALLGDLMSKHETGGMFTVEDVAAEQPRADAFEISPTGPLPGKKMRAPKADAAALEAEILAGFGLGDDEIRRLGPGTRRSLRYPLDPEATIEPGPTPNSLRLRCFLPSGAYATVLLDELVKPDGGVFAREPAPERSDRASSPAEPAS